MWMVALLFGFFLFFLVTVICQAATGAMRLRGFGIVEAKKAPVTFWINVTWLVFGGLLMAGFSGWMPASAAIQALSRNVS